MASLTSSFTVDLVGSETGETFKGTFNCKIRLSLNEQLRRDAIRRQLLGANPESTSPRAGNIAEILSEIAVHLMEPIPSWWSGAAGGLELFDDNVIAAVYDGIMLEKKKVADAVKAKGEAAVVELKKAETK